MGFAVGVWACSDCRGDSVDAKALEVLRLQTERVLAVLSDPKVSDADRVVTARIALQVGLADVRVLKGEQD